MISIAITTLASCPFIAGGSVDWWYEFAKHSNGYATNYYQLLLAVAYAMRKDIYFIALFLFYADSI